MRCSSARRTVRSLAALEISTMGLSIPAVHVSDGSQVKGGGTVLITSRSPGGFAGVSTITIAVGFDPGVDLYPTGGFELKVDMNDGVNGGYKTTSIELINSHGKINPTVFLTGRCSGGSRERKGPVSYTHLRAHETPEHLVCRLLLE